MFAETVTRNLLAIAEAYRRATGKTMGQVSKQFYGNSGFFAELRAGTRSISVEKIDEMIVAFQAAWPKGAPRPFMHAVHMWKSRRSGEVSRGYSSRRA